MKFFKTNPFLSLSFSSFIANALIIGVMFIFMLLPNEIMNSSSRMNAIFFIERSIYNIVVFLATLFGLTCVGIGFKKRENKKGLILSLIINLLLLLMVINNFIFDILIAQPHITGY